MRTQRGLLVFIAFATLLIPAVGSFAGPRSELEDKSSTLEDVRHQIEADEAAAGTIEEKVDALNRSLTRLQIEINGLNEDIAEAEAKVHAAEARIDQTQAEIDKIEDAATEQAVALYKAGATDTLDVLLNSESLTELDERMALLGVAAQENTGALVRFGRLQVKVRGQHEELFEEKEALEAVLKDRSSLQSAQIEKRTELTAALAELNVRLGANKDREDHLESEIDGIKQKILEAQAKASVAALGTSNRGFIWPLNGGITSPYGPRWGRMHTGIDINGYTGQPIVAAKEGRVIMASSYSGYGNTVIVDHGGGYSTLYAHMSSFNTSSGAGIDQGDIIGYVGCTGNCYGDHLHFEVRVNGSPTDPMPYLP
ncbi:MAG: murein hydrolase activator EnvC family protein [Actinomycetota bacterium]